MRGAAFPSSRGRRRVTFAVVAILVATAALTGLGSSPAQAESSKELRAKAARLADKIDKLSHEFEKMAEIGRAHV